MIPLIALLAAAVLAMVVIRTGAIALEMTGLSRDAARFQALSAFFGAGFTTGESELVVNHPVRRRVIRDLIIVGNIGILTLITATILTFVGEGAEGGLKKGVIIVFVLLLLGLLSRSRLWMAFIDRTITAALKQGGVVRALDYESMLHVREGYSVGEFLIEADHALVGRTLGQSRPRAEGLTVLGITRANGSYEGLPHGDATIHAGDTLIVYGQESALRRLASQRTDDSTGINTNAEAADISSRVEPAD